MTARAHPSRRSAHRFLLAFVAAILLSDAVGAASAFGSGGTMSIASSASRVTFGKEVTITGTLSSAAGCVAGRSLTLEWRPAGSTAFEPAADGAAGSDGAFAFGHAEPHTGAYRVTASAEGTCEPVTSDEVLVRVRARVDASMAADSAVAGSCLTVDANVAPPKPGQPLALERRVDDRWMTLDVLTLGADSSASGRACFGWEDVGGMRLRARWASQDILNETGVAALGRLRVEPAGWMRRIEELIAGRAVSVSIGEDGTFLYGRAPGALRTPASNEKLLLSMALFDTFGPGFRIRTIAASTDGPRGGAIDGDLWILGRGDPEVDRGTMAALARRIAAQGIDRIGGRVFGATTYFRRDWDAPGWHDNARDYVARPTALTFEGNLDARGHHARSPETRAAQALTEELEELGVRVRGRPGAGRPPPGLAPITSVRSRTLQALLAKLLRPSDNFMAEVLGKRLGAEASGAPGTIAKAARALRGWVRMRGGVTFDLNDASGLSYANRVTAEGIVRLLWVAEEAAWGTNLFDALPTGGQGTLRERLRSVSVRAKTGTLTGISALSGWVRLERSGTWAEFSILSTGMPKWVASELEDRIVRLVRDRAVPASPAERPA